MAGQPLLQEPLLHFFSYSLFSFLLFFHSSLKSTRSQNLLIIKYQSIRSLSRSTFFGIFIDIILKFSYRKSIICLFIYLSIYLRYLHRYSHLIASQPCLLNIEPEISRSSHLFISSQLNSTQLNHPLQKLSSYPRNPIYQTHIQPRSPHFTQTPTHEHITPISIF